MQRQIIHGVPFFVDAQKRIYTWEAESGSKPQHVGSLSADGEITFVGNHLSNLSGKLATWRAGQKPRPRKPTSATAATPATNSRGHSTGKASSDSSASDSD
jgi:hypothetical protein